MGKSSKAKGKERAVPVRSRGSRRDDHDNLDEDPRNQLTRQAQAQPTKKHRRDPDDDDQAEEDEYCGDNEDRVVGWDDAPELEPEPDNWQAELDNSEAYIRRLQATLDKSRRDHEALQRQRQAATSATTGAGSSSSTASTTPTHAPAGNPSQPAPWVFDGAPKWIELPKKADQTIAKIRFGLGAKNKIDWRDIQDYIRQSITRCGLDTSKMWKRQDPTKLVLLYAILEKRIPGLRNFEDNWATTHLVQSRFNHRRGHQLDTEREEREEAHATALAAEQMDLDAAGLQRIATQSPEPQPQPQRRTWPSNSGGASDSPDQSILVQTGAPAIDSAPTQPSSRSRAPVPTHTPNRVTHVPSADPSPSEKPMGMPRPRMRLPPPAHNEPLPNTAPAQSTPRRSGPTNAPTLASSVPVVPRPLGQTSSTMEAWLPSPQPSLLPSPRPSSGTGGGPSTVQHTVSNPPAKKRSANAAGLEPEPEPELAPSKKPPTRGPTAKQRRVATTTANPSGSAVHAPGSLRPAPAARRATLRSSKAAVAAAAAVENTAAARNTPAEAAPQKRGKNKGKELAAPSSPLSGPLEAEPEEPSENDDGYHTLEEDN